MLMTRERPLLNKKNTKKKKGFPRKITKIILWRLGPAHVADGIVLSLNKGVYGRYRYLYDSQRGTQNSFFSFLYSFSSLSLNNEKAFVFVIFFRRTYLLLGFLRDSAGLYIADFMQRYPFPSTFHHGNE